MCLEEDQQPLVVATARCFQSGTNFCGVMAVIINQGDARIRSFDLKAAANACKFSESRPDQVRRNIQRQPDCCRSGGIEHIVNSGWRCQVKYSKTFAVISQ